MLEVSTDRAEADRVIRAIRTIVRGRLFYEETDGDDEQVTYAFAELPAEKQEAIESALDQIEGVRFAWR